MIYFCTTTYLKDNTNIGQNVDELIITPIVKTSCDMWVRSVLGSYFYNDLLDKFNAQTLTANETTLVGDYIKPTVAWRVATDAAFGTSLQMKNKGVQTQSGDYSANSDFKGVSFISHQSREKAEFYQNRLFNYLVDNKDLFTNFTSDLNTDSTAKLACYVNNNFMSGIYLI